MRTRPDGYSNNSQTQARIYQKKTLSADKTDVPNYGRPIEFDIVAHTHSPTKTKALFVDSRRTCGRRPASGCCCLRGLAAGQHSALDLPHCDWLFYVSLLVLIGHVCCQVPPFDSQPPASDVISLNGDWLGKKVRESPEGDARRNTDQILHQRF